ncbi:hypothetical protein PULV_a1545 [Pseudoalteromonas ulvae UL12]|uniref:Uncharacterized protein n=2 Tax=Pseudoalteromonas ulvae TaxID=107327 RepID=A0A244CMC0_PSEDV|nr:hypothetical protein [Pseudoalteromonas ulvae UL12]OUL56777.1 hypothetical protein B1199_15505 [Pseudoalteromonas ulvae]
MFEHVKSKIDARVNQQLIKRQHHLKKLMLKHKNVYVLPSRLGLAFLCFAILVFLLGSNYQNNMIIMTSYLLLSLLLVSVIQGYLNLSNTEIEYIQCRPGDVQSGFELLLSFKNLRTAQQIKLAAQWLNPVDAFDCSHSAKTIKLQFTPSKRGIYALPRIKISSSYPFGLITIWSYLVYQDSTFVYPNQRTLLNYSHTHEQPDEGDHSNQAQGSDDFDGIRTYQKGDSFSRISWKHYAKQHELVSKQFNQLGNGHVIFDFALLPDDFETRLEYLAYLLQQAQHDELIYGLTLPQRHIGANHGPEHLAECLKALSEV